MTSALRGEGVGSKAYNSSDRLHEWDSDKGVRGSKNPKFLQTSFVNCLQHCGVILGRKRESDVWNEFHGRAGLHSGSEEFGGGAEWCQLDGRDETKL